VDDHQPNTRKYESDFYAWANEQATLLREGRFAEADVENIADEIESLGRSEKRDLVNRLAVLLAHLLKWQFQPVWRGKSWRLTIKEQRRRLSEHLDENPSLKPLVGEAIARLSGRDRGGTEGYPVKRRRLAGRVPLHARAGFGRPVSARIERAQAQAPYSTAIE
jgi:hypothetical protein